MTKSRPKSGARFLTLAQVSDELGCSAAQTYALVRSGSLRAMKVGGRGQWRVGHSSYLGKEAHSRRTREVSTLMTRLQHALSISDPTTSKVAL